MLLKECVCMCLCVCVCVCVCVCYVFYVNGNQNFYYFFFKCYGLWSKLLCTNSVKLKCSQCCVCFNLLRNTVSLIYTRMWCKSRQNKQVNVFFLYSVSKQLFLFSVQKFLSFFVSDLRCLRLLQTRYTAVLICPQPDQEGNKLGSMTGTRAISTTSRRELSSGFFFLQDKAPKEIHAIMTETLACFPPGGTNDLSAPQYLYRETQKRELLKNPTKTEEIQQKKIYWQKLNRYNLPFKRR